MTTILGRFSRIHYTRGMIQLPIAIEIGLRYTRAKNKLGGSKRDGFLSFISGISMAGIALGVAALIIVLSVMNGFQKDVRDRMLSVLSHIEISSNLESVVLMHSSRESLVLPLAVN